MNEGDRTELFIESFPGEIRAALADERGLAELLILREGGRGRLGDIYLGRVARIEPALSAAFVDLGLERPGFLSLPAGGRRPAEGAAIVVQIFAEAVGTKGPKLTREMALPGYRLVFFPGRGRFAANPRLDPAAAGKVLASLKGKGEDAALRDEAERLRARWREIAAAAEAARAPARLAGDRELGAAARAFLSPRLARLVVEGPAALPGLKAWLRREAPELVPRVELHRGAEALFETMGFEAEIERMTGPRVRLDTGAEIAIEEGETLAAIDVNLAAAAARGARSSRAVNLAAAPEIVRLVRLRNLAGLIFVDGLRMRAAEDRARLLAAFRGALARDPVPGQAHGFTRTGLIEITRERRRAPVVEVLLDPAPPRAKQAATVGFAALRRLIGEGPRLAGANVSLLAAPDVARFLTGPARAHLEAAARSAGVHVRVEARPDFVRERFDFAAD